jgi:hypothetical protein
MFRNPLPLPGCLQGMVQAPHLEHGEHRQLSPGHATRAPAKGPRAKVDNLCSSRVMRLTNWSHGSASIGKRNLYLCAAKAKG